ncbi:hypothetical protein J3R83DRAFT_11764 [Lanmaoa asiatica]|nr:hypothetical protein J3R83DRAFT_11764 [Lanmaoa asiatica]
MKSAHNTAISSNEKIFPVFARKLASRDAKDFVNTAHKLAVWLGSEKAYYPAARPKIALAAFMDTSMHHSALAEAAEHLRHLIRAVIPFRHLFPESELQSRLQRVILDTKLSLSRVSTSTTHANVPPQEPVTAKYVLLCIPSPTLGSPVHPQPTMSPIPVPQTQPSSPVPSAVKAVPDGSVHEDTSQERDSSEVASSGQNLAIPSLASPVTNTPQDPDENISPTIPFKPQLKRARRAELSEELKARDLDWFKSNQGIAAVNEDPIASTSKASESSPALVSDTPHILSSPKKKTARMVPSRRLPRRIPLDAAQEVESGVSASGLPSKGGEKAGSSKNAEGFSVQMDVDEQNPHSERMESDARSTAILEACDVQKIPWHEVSPTPKLQLALAPSNGPPIKPEIPQIDHQSPSDEPPFLNSESPISARQSAALPKPTLDRMKSMGTSTSELHSESFLPETPAPQSPRMLQLRSPILPPLVNAFEPPLDLKFRISQIWSGQPQQLGMDASQRRFDEEMTVIHSTQGKPFTHTHMIDISLNQSISSKISKWVNRKFHPSEASQGVCISLACYRLPEFFDKIKLESGKHDIEELTSRSSCSWPYSNRLSLHVNDEEKRTIITLSPPVFLTPNQCVDISSLMKPGNNTLEIRQQDDLSEYLVVLHAHRPTRAQLAELDVVKTADEQWKWFLDALSMRAAPGKMLSTAVVGVI